MSSIQAGFHTVREILAAANFDFEAKAAADHLDGGADYRRVQVGGLGFDDLDYVINIPTTADDILITVDGKADTVLDVTLNEKQQEERRLSFESAADTNGPADRQVIQ